MKAEIRHAFSFIGIQLSPNLKLTLADQMSNQLAPEQSEIFTRIMELREEYIETGMSESYVVGFRDGATLMLELLNTGK